MQRTLYEPEHESYRDSIRTFLTKEVLPSYLTWEEAGIVPRELFSGLADLGAFGFDVPEEFGGHGVSDFRFNSVLHEESQALGVLPATTGPMLQADVVMPYLVDLSTV